MDNLNDMEVENEHLKLELEQTRKDRDYYRAEFTNHEDFIRRRVEEKFCSMRSDLYEELRNKLY